MNRQEYRNACRYASKLTHYYRDIVHDAYLDHFLRTGRDLFDSPNRTIVVTVRNHYYNSVRRNRYMYNGKYYQKNYIPLNAPSLVEDMTNEEYIQSKYDYHTKDSLMDNIVLNDQVELIKTMITERQGELLDKAMEGYTIMDLAEIEGKNQSSIRKSFSYIKEVANGINLERDISRF